MVSTILGRYKLIEELKPSYSLFSTPNIKQFFGLDQNENEVLVKIFYLPSNEISKQFAIRLWDREIRLLRTIMAKHGRKNFLKLIEAKFDSENSRLVLVTEYYGITIQEHNNQVDSFFPKIRRDEQARVFFWNQVLRLSEGIDILHDSKVIHRNINPSTVFFDINSDEYNPYMKLGDFTWGLYLFNLHQMNNFTDEILSQISQFIPPEYIQSSNEKQKRHNIYTIDIYSLGMVICFILLENFPKDIPNSVQNHKNQLKQIRSLITNNELN